MIEIGAGHRNFAISLKQINPFDSQLFRQFLQSRSCHKLFIKGCDIGGHLRNPDILIPIPLIHTLKYALIVVFCVLLQLLCMRLLPSGLCHATQHLHLCGDHTKEQQHHNAAGNKLSCKRPVVKEFRSVS